MKQLYGNPLLCDKLSRLQVGKHYIIKVYLLNLLRERNDSSKTTEIYTHVSKKAIGNIKNPVDEFFK